VSGSRAIEAVLFDIDGTLLDHDRAMERGLAAAVVRVRPDLPDQRLAELLAEWLRLEHLHYGEYLAGEASLAEQRRRRARGLLAVLGVSEPEARELDDWFAAYLEDYRAAWSLFDDVEPALAALGGRAAGAITNADLDIQRAKLERFGLERQLRLLVASSEDGVTKPDPGIFTRAAQALGRPPERIAYVGDRLDVDARGAAAAGMLGVWLDRSGDGGDPGDVAVIGSMTELEELIG
jgi:putative hydrolase of the HAD superfamily